MDDRPGGHVHPVVVATHVAQQVDNRLGVCGFKETNLHERFLPGLAARQQSEMPSTAPQRQICHAHATIASVLSATLAFDVQRPCAHCLIAASVAPGGPTTLCPSD